jgi:hypothetical protein
MNINAIFRNKSHINLYYFIIISILLFVYDYYYIIEIAEKKT